MGLQNFILDAIIKASQAANKIPEAGEGAAAPTEVGQPTVPDLPQTKLPADLAPPPGLPRAGGVSTAPPSVGPKPSPPVMPALEASGPPSPEPPSNPGAEAVLNTPLGVTPTKTLKRPAMSTATPIPEQPFDPTTRAEYGPLAQNFLQQIENSQDYQSRLDALGGGRRVTHDETIAAAVKQPDMKVEELANWPAHTPVNQVDVVRAGILRAHWADQYLNAIRAGDPITAAGAEQVIRIIEPGFNNVSAAPGRTLEAMKIVDQANDQMNLALELRDAGIPFEQIRAALRQQNIEKSRDINFDQLDGMWKHVNSVLDWTVATKLSSPVTLVKKAVSDGMAYLTRGLEQTTKGAILKTMGMDPEADAALKYAWSSGEGFKRGMQAFINSYKMADPKEGSIHPADYVPGPEDKIPPLRVLNPFRNLGAVAEGWKEVTAQSELNGRIYAQARNEGLSGDALAQRISELSKSPPPSWVRDAYKVGDEYTFQEAPDKLLRALSGIRRMPGGKLIWPVLGIPYNITKFALRRGPTGLLSPQNWRDFNAGGVRRADVLAKFAVGSLFTATAMHLVNSGVINGAYPQDPKERAMWDYENRKPWTIRIGDHWVKMNTIQPVGMYMTMMAAVHEAARAGKEKKADSLAQKANTFLSSVLYQGVHGGLDTSFLDTFSSLLDIANSPNRLQTFEQLMAAGLIPTIVQDVRNQTDDTVRKPTSVGEAIENMIPGFSQNVPPKATLSGDVRHLEMDPWLRATKQSSPVFETPETKAMRESGYVPHIPSAKITVHGHGAVELKGTQKQAFTEDMYQATQAGMARAIGNPRWSVWSKDVKAKVLAKLVAGQHRIINTKYAMLLGLYGEDAKQRMLPWWEERQSKLQMGTSPEPASAGTLTPPGGQ